MERLYKNKEWKVAHITFKQENFNQPFSKLERTYEVRRERSKAFQADKISNSIWGDCLDGKDLGVRLDHYRWKVEDISIVE